MTSNTENKEGREEQDSVQKSSEEKKFDFSSVYSDNFPKILSKLNISLVVTSYQAQRLFFVRSEKESIEINYKYFPRPMGVYADRDRLTLGTLSQVVEFKRNDDLLRRIHLGELDQTNKMSKKILEKDSVGMTDFLNKRNEELALVKKADALFLARASLTTGMINIHDIAWGDGGLWVVNSTFSCLATLSPNCSFVARWRPPFISSLVPEDRCHLNGMAMQNGRPRYVTTFNQCNSKDSWVSSDSGNGTLIDVETDEILINTLTMPHSPRCNNGRVYFCDSGTGEVLSFDPQNKNFKKIIKLQGFTRGIAFIGPLMFVGLSKIRSSERRKPPPISEEFDETHCGIWVINLEDSSEVAYIRFTGDVQQIYDIAVVPDAIHPELIDNNDILIRHTFDFQEAAL